MLLMLCCSLLLLDAVHVESFLLPDPRQLLGRHMPGLSCVVTRHPAPPRAYAHAADALHCPALLFLVLQRGIEDFLFPCPPQPLGRVVP